MLAKDIKLEIFYGISSPWALYGAPEIQRIAEKYGVTIILRPIRVIEENGGIPLKFRPDARLKYHDLELRRWAKKLGVDLKPKPKFYPLPPGRIRLAAQAIIRMQNLLGRGHPTVLAFSYAIQKLIWIEEGDASKVEEIERLARGVGAPEDQITNICADKIEDESDPAVIEWNGNLEAAIKVGIFGTPNYVVNDELFWGQDRLPFVEDKIVELLKE